MDHIYYNIEGFFNFENLYVDIIEHLPDNAKFVEVGVWKGKSISFAVVHALQRNKNIEFYAVDSFLGSTGEPFLEHHSSVIHKTLYYEYIKNVMPILNHINTIALPSVEAAALFENRSLDFVYIDASHKYENVKADILAWSPKIKQGGYLGGHDYVDDPDHPDYGVTKAVNEIVGKNNVVVYNPDWPSWLTRIG